MRVRFPYAALIAVMLVLPQAAFAGEQFARVVVSVAPLAPYVDAILHGVGKADNLLRPGQDPHNFAFTPSQAQLLDKADVIIVPDLGMSPFLKGLLAKKPRLRVIELSKLAGAEPLPYAAENPWLSAVKEAGDREEDGHDHDHDAHHEKDSDFATGHQWAKKKAADVAPPAALIDPHFWLDPERMAAIAPALAEAIGQAAPGNQAQLTLNAEALATHLRREVMPAMRELLAAKERPFEVSNKPRIPFITYHAAYQYFLGRFGLQNHGDIVVRPEEYTGAKSLQSMLSVAGRVHINCVIGEAETTVVKRIAELSGARVIVLSPEQLVEAKDVPALPWITNGYDRLLYQTAKRFGECL